MSATADDVGQAFLESGGTSAHPLDASNDPTATATATDADPAQAFLESGGKSAHPLTATPTRPSFGEAATGLGEGLLTATTGGVGALAGGLSYLGRRLEGGSEDEAQKERADIQSTMTYQPRTVEGKKAAADISDISSYIGEKPGHLAGGALAAGAHALGASPEVEGVAGATGEVAGNSLQFLLGAKAKTGKPYSINDVASPQARIAPRTTAGPPLTIDQPLSAAAADRTPYFEIHDPQTTQELGLKSEKAEAPTQGGNTGNLTPTQQQGRMELAKRVGLTEVRKSAIEGDAQAAADDFDSTKYTDDQMGQRMRPIIAAEKQALTEHAAGIIDDLGAKEGTDQSTMSAKGKVMAKPLDMLNDYADRETTKAYDAAREKGGTDPVQFPTLEAALQNKTLKNSLLAQGKEGFLHGVQSQWDDFHENNPGGINASVAEQYRQFLNTLWKTNPEAVGKLKEAMDTDMQNHFGEDLFGPSRQLYQLKKTLLDNPKGVAQIAGRDPHTPVNRTTAYEDIPDKVANLTADQFKNLWNTYKMMPDEIQPAAQAAMSEIKGHQVNRLLDAGARQQTQWNKKGVNTELSNNSENFKTAFADDAANAAKIKDLKDAGEMLRFNASYRGAHAQKSNMLRKGIGVGAEYGGGGIGGTVGGMMAGPPGVAAGAFLGKKAGASVANKLENRAIKKDVESRVVKLDD